MIVVARHFETGLRIRYRIQGDRFATCEPIGEGEETDDWIVPAFWDIQTNGGNGISFVDESLDVDQVFNLVESNAEQGAARLCPTLITASFEAAAHAVQIIKKACDLDREIDRRILGIHLEGPAISAEEGYRGAHPKEWIRDPDIRELKRLHKLSGDRIVLSTLAPERRGAIDYIREARKMGIVVALGHTAADRRELTAAIVAGATLSTHLGNGIASELPRHPNPIWTQAAEDRLFASLIADDHHLDPAVLKVLFRAKTPERTILVSDAGPLAGLPPGVYGDWEVQSSGKIVVAGTSYLAGANQPLETGLSNLIKHAGASLAQAVRTVTSNPARLLGRDEPRLAPGEPADFVLLRTTDSPANEARPFPSRQVVIGGKVCRSDERSANPS